MLIGGIYMYETGTGVVTIVKPSEWAIYTTMAGETRVIDMPGRHMTWFNEVWHYPRQFAVR